MFPVLRVFKLSKRMFICAVSQCNVIHHHPSDYRAICHNSFFGLVKTEIDLHNNSSHHCNATIAAETELIRWSYRCYFWSVTASPEQAAEKFELQREISLNCIYDGDLKRAKQIFHIPIMTYPTPVTTKYSQHHADRDRVSSPLTTSRGQHLASES